MTGVFLCKEGYMVIRTGIPYEELTKDPQILKYYEEVIDKIIKVDKYVSEIRMKPGVHTTKNMRKHTIVQWLILEIVLKDGEMLCGES